jgi:membrane protein YqaA with SNARE-associated domain
MTKWFKWLHAWSLRWASSKWGAWALFLCAFADASFLPLPTPMFFLTLTLLNTAKAYKYALLGTMGTLVGSFAGYAIGHFAWLTVNGEFTGFAQYMFNTLPGFTVSTYDSIQTLFAKWDFWILFVAALIPLPYKIFSISSGVFDINIIVFCLATLISQGIKFYLLAFLVIKTGKAVKRILEFNFKPILISVVACVAIAIILIKVF